MKINSKDMMYIRLGLHQLINKNICMKTSIYQYDAYYEYDYIN